MRSPSRPGLAPAILLLLVVAGCVSVPRQSPEARAVELLSASPPPPGRTCQISPLPETLPSPEQLVEVDALRADLGAYLGERQIGPGFVLMSMGYDRFGSNIRRVVIEHDVGTAAADSIQRLVFKHRRTLDEAERDWGVRLRIGVDEAMRLEVGRSEVCAPRPRDAGLAMAMEQTMGAGTRFRGGIRESTIWVRLLVNPQGQVMGATVERGIVGGALMEQRIIDHVRSFFFEPALNDGDPVSGYVSIPLVVRER
jgi:hypothetical protein